MIGMTNRRRVILAEACLHGAPGELPTPVALALQDAESGVRTVVRADDCAAVWASAVGPDDILVSLDAERVVKCLTRAGLPLPRHLIDLGVEARMKLNGLAPAGIGDLTLTLVRFGVTRAPLLDSPSILLLSQGNLLSVTDAQQLMANLGTRLDCLADLWRAVDDFNLSQALLRGRYIKPVAHMALRGIPVDVATLLALDDHRADLLRAAVAAAPLGRRGKPFFKDGAVFQESRVYEIAAFSPHWPRDADNKVSLDNKTIELMSPIHIELRGLADARRRVDGVGFAMIPVGRDGRHRFRQRPFASSTGRNQLLAREALLVQTSWRRNLIVPPQRRVILVADFSSEELAVVAILSGDLALQDVYRASDPYIRMAQIFGMAPTDAIRDTHERIRDIFKIVTLAVQYGGGPGMISALTGIKKDDAADLLARHRKLFPRFWAWSEAAVNEGLLTSQMQTAFGWKRHVEVGTSVRTLQNFPAQANGGEILRMAAIGLVEAGLDLIGTIHDSAMVEADAQDAEQVKVELERHMVGAGRAVLGTAGPDLKVKTVVIRPGHRWHQKGKDQVWGWAVERLRDLGVEVPNANP